jgi:hypothetical protein
MPSRARRSSTQMLRNLSFEDDAEVSPREGVRARVAFVGTGAWFTGAVRAAPGAWPIGVRSAGSTGASGNELPRSCKLPRCCARFAGAIGLRSSPVCRQASLLGAGLVTGLRCPADRRSAHRERVRTVAPGSPPSRVRRAGVRRWCRLLRHRSPSRCPVLGGLSVRQWATRAFACGTSVR